ncbi:MAG: DUF423 domain-containing protein [Chloroflexi bacterium]|nr:MAG: DUF423 domain-containing protein [Chloroflexota bacterium]
MDKVFTIIGSALMMVGVGAGAFGAHGLSTYFERFPNLEGTFETAVRYHIYHAIGILFMAWAVTKWPGALTSWAGYLLFAGVLIFSGSLYLLVLTRQGWLGAITPIGGVAFIAGWTCLLIAAWRS